MKRGFTLVELLAVIVILAVILVIAVPQINNVIKETKKNSLASTAKIIAAKVEEATVENEILENNEALTCANLVKLDDNYGSCTVSMVNGKGTVTIVGAGKFDGITCTGTKDNMVCSDGSTPQYIYAYGVPEEGYISVRVTNFEACKNWFLYDWYGYDLNDDIEPEVVAFANSVCNNSDDLGNVEHNISASEYFLKFMRNDELTFSAISSFAEGTMGYINGGSTYTNIKYGNGNPVELFIRWPGTGPFTNSVTKSVCILYGGDPTCLEGTSSAYSENKNKLETLFGSSKCEANPEVNDTEYWCEDGAWSCAVYNSGELGCSGNNALCRINADGSVRCIDQGVG